MLQAILNKSWWQLPTRHQLYSHLPPITKTIQFRRTRHAGHCWRSRDELISDILLWTPTYGQAKAGQPAWTYIQQLCEDTECSPEDLPEAMNDREKRRERVRDIRATSTTWWWWWWFFYNVPCSRGDFGRQFIISSLLYNVEYWVWNTNTILRILTCNATLTVFIVRPTNHRNMAQGLFKEGPGAGRQPKDARYFLKIPRAPLAFPLKGMAQAPGNKPSPKRG